MAGEHQFIPRSLEPLRGDEPLADATVLDFWRWALSDLRMNTARGYLVEYLIARALHDPSLARVEWGPWDVQAADGTLIEVKTSGRLQSWASKAVSTPSWSFKSVRADKVWSDAAGEYVSVDPATRVHVWVFALQTAEDPALYDPLDLEQWEFRVIPHRELLGACELPLPRELEPVAFAMRLAVSIAAVGDVRRGGEGPDRRRADSL